jgi:hypothetical protein
VPSGNQLIAQAGRLENGFFFHLKLLESFLLFRG